MKKEQNITKTYQMRAQDKIRVRRTKVMLWDRTRAYKMRAHPLPLDKEYVT